MLQFRERIKEIRKKAKLTQDDLGKMVGVTKVSICCYEKGTRTPTLDTLMELADALSVDFKYLIGEDSYVVAEDDKNYGMNVSKEEIDLIKEFRKHPEIYSDLLKDPERTIKIIEQKMK